MSRHDPLVCVRQMLDHAREATAMVRGRVRADLDSDRMLNLSVMRLLEVMGEAATRIAETIGSSMRRYLGGRPSACATG